MFPKNVRVKDRSAIEAARKAYCECCWVSGAVHVHHVYSVGSGGSDIKENLISLCINCHDKAHRGLIRKEYLAEIVSLREGMEVEEIEKLSRRG